MYNMGRIKIDNLRRKKEAKYGWKNREKG